MFDDSEGRYTVHGVGKRVGAIFGEICSVTRRAAVAMGPERDSPSHGDSLAALGTISTIARRACRSAAGLAARGVGFNGAIRGCLCIFRS